MAFCTLLCNVYSDINPSMSFSICSENPKYSFWTIPFFLLRSTSDQWKDSQSSALDQKVAFCKVCKTSRYVMSKFFHDRIKAYDWFNDVPEMTFEDLFLNWWYMSFNRWAKPIKPNISMVFDISKINSITEVTLKLHSYSRATVFDTLRASHDRHEANWFASTNQI